MGVCRGYMVTRETLASRGTPGLRLIKLLPCTRMGLADGRRALFDLHMDLRTYC